MLKIVFLAGLALLAPTAPALAETFAARAVYISDGDSLTVAAPGRGRIKLRLYGLDAPELDQPYGPEAKLVLARLAYKKTVRVETLAKDRYGRLVAIVWADDRNLNLALAEAGLAWVYERYCGRADLCPALRQAQTRARADRRGLWAADRPSPPERWRWGRE